MKKLNNHSSTKPPVSHNMQHVKGNKVENSANSHIVNDIINFLDCAKGFSYALNETNIKISQNEDTKTMSLNLQNVEKVLSRQDFDGSPFLQVNFHGGSKVLITKFLIGFKPTGLVGFDSTKIPKVVTTVDLKSVVSAIEETYEDDSHQTEVELEVLTKVYYSIMLGAEAVGFDMTTERSWFMRSMLNRKAATA